MLAETFPKTIVVNLELEKNLPTIHADPTQVHQVLLNICVNARDAMSSSGTLTLKTTHVVSEEMTRYFQTVPEVTYLLLAISDTGSGMSNETKGRIFEPFFTTKEKGKGTGLGLSVVYGIMKSHNGFVRVESELGKGTTFFLYFPIPKKTDEPAARIYNHIEQIAGGSETVFLVEDEVVLSELTKTFLEMNGYRVLTAKDGEEAIELYKKHYATIDIVVTDMGLPKLTGLEVLIEMKKIKPETKLIFASGYIEADLKSLMFQQGAKFFLFKPYQPNEILKVIRNVLDTN
jgi:CheY-like chemotaxis protein